MFKLKAVLAFFILLLNTSVFSQKPTLVFHHLSVNDGLSENTIRATIEDRKGYMWFGCEDGLNKYDGYNFTIYRNDNIDTFTISSRNIRLLFIDSKNNLWVATSNGLNMYDPLLDVFYSFRNNKYPALKPLHGNIAGIAEDHEGNLWISTEDNGLYKISSLYKAPEHFNFPFNDPSKRLYYLAIKSDTSLWVGTRDGLLSFNTVTQTFTDLRPKYGRGYEVRSIYKDNKQAIWMSTSHGLKIVHANGSFSEYLYNPSNPKGINGNNVIEVIPYTPGKYLIGIDGGGIDYFDVNSQTFHHYTEELSSTNINCLFRDSKGDIWAGTYLNGMNYSNAATNLFVLKKNNIRSETSIRKGIVTKFLNDSRGNLWVATDGGGLYKRTKGSEKFIQYSEGVKGLTSNVIISLIEDENGYIWLTTYGAGICKYDPARDSFQSYRAKQNNENSLFNDQTKALCLYNDQIWISGYGAGIGVYDKSTGKFSNYQADVGNPRALQSDWVQCFYNDKDGNLWLGTFAGLTRYNKSTDDFTTFTFKNLLTNHHVDINTVLDIVEDDEGNLWFGTMGNGLVCFNKKTHYYTFYTTDHGLSNNCIKSVIMDNKNTLWLSTNNGISRFNVKEKKAKAYTLKDGIPPSSFYFNAKFKDNEGRIYFGTNNGYLIIDPGMTGENKRIPPIVITDLKIFNQSIFPGKDSPLKYHISETHEVVLKHSQNSLTFEFSALNFSSSQNNKYAYWLEGFDETWFMAGTQRSATYTNLNPGTYTFRVKGSNNDNVWNETGTFITITIEPPFWKTWWFKTISVLLSIVLVYLIFKWRISVVRHKNIILEELVQKRTSELNEANERLETFVYKASHDIKGPLKSIIGLTKVGQKDIQDENARQYFSHILKSTLKLDSLLMDLLQVTKVKKATIQPEKINFTEIISEVLSSFENFPGFNKMKITTDIKELSEFYTDKKLLYSIIQNLVENPIKYADAEKKENLLEIKVRVEKKQAVLTFKDNGIGIPAELQKNIFEMFFKANENANGTGLGLYIVKTTVEKLNGSIRLESKLGEGATFIVTL